MIRWTTPVSRKRITYQNWERRDNKVAKGDRAELSCSTKAGGTVCVFVVAQIALVSVCYGCRVLLEGSVRVLNFCQREMHFQPSSSSVWNLMKWFRCLFTSQSIGRYCNGKTANLCCLSRVHDISKYVEIKIWRKKTNKMQQLDVYY